MISEETIKQVKESVDIIALIGRYVELKQRGRDFWGCCPFHQEKTPSFKVSPERRSWHCFGCGEGGDAIDFLMRIESIGFIEAIKRLATECNIEIEGNGLPTDRRSLKSREQILKEINATAAFFYHRCLTEEDRSAESARDYLKSRAVSDESIEEWSLGYAPGLSRLSSYLLACDFNQEDLIDAGLAKLNEEGKLQDRYFSRVMIPVCDEAGDTVGFAGRSITDVGVKYLNNPEGPIFKKSDLLFGIEKAKSAILKTGAVVLVEGYMDAIALHQAGIRNVVALMGTAFNEKHAMRLSALADKKIVFLYDGDDAGKRAAERSMELVESLESLPCKDRFASATLPDGLDPADFILSRGPSALRKIINALPLSEREKTPTDGNVAALIRWLYSNDDIGEFDEEEVAERYRELYAKHVVDTKRGKPGWMRTPANIIRDELVAAGRNIDLASNHPAMSDDLSWVVRPVEVSVSVGDDVVKYSVSPAPTANFTDALALLVWRLSDGFPYEAIRELCENFIHAYFEDVEVTISRGGKRVVFSDGGPGPNWEDDFQRAGYSTATEPMKRYIRSIGSGFSIVKEQCEAANSHISLIFGNRHGKGFSAYLVAAEEEGGRNDNAE